VPWIYVGSFGGGPLPGGLSVLELGSSGFTPVQLLDIERPSFVAAAAGGRFLLVATHTPTFSGAAGAGLLSYGIDHETGRLTFISARRLPATHGVFVTTDRSASYAVVACSFGGVVAVVELAPDGTLGEVIQAVRHRGEALVPMGSTRRPAVPPIPPGHCLPHSVLFDPGNTAAYVADLGANRMVRYPFAAGTGLLDVAAQCDLEVPRKAGPRHTAMHPNGRIMYAINEVGSLLTTYDIGSGAGGQASLIGAADTRPAGFAQRNTGSDVHVHPSGRYLYVANRGSDQLTRFDTDDDGRAVRLAEHTSTGGHWPRTFALSPRGDTAVVANERSNEIVSFGIDQRTGALQAAARLPVAAPTSIAIVDRDV
jgi:6-phosphogluconolactonase